MMDSDNHIGNVVFALYLATVAIYVYLLFGNGLSGLSVLQFAYPYHATFVVPAPAMNVMLFGAFILAFVISSKKWNKVACVITLAAESAGFILICLTGLHTLLEIAAFIIAIGVLIGTAIFAMVAFFGD